MRLTLEELDSVKEGIFAYIDELLEYGEDDTNYCIKLALVGEDRFLEVDLIVVLMDGMFSFSVVNLATISQDEYLDILSETNKSKE